MRRCKMTHEWKVGDRFSVEGVVTELADRDGDYRALFDGHESDGYVISGEMARATLIPPAQEPKAPPPLDTSKPIRIKGDSQEIRYIGMRSDGRVVYETTNLILWASNPDALENIPTPKRTMSREVVMISGWHELVYASSCVGSTGKVLARGTITITEGEGL
jgi:hypothetical protein